MRRPRLRVCRRIAWPFTEGRTCDRHRDVSLQTPLETPCQAIIDYAYIVHRYWCHVIGKHRALGICCHALFCKKNESFPASIFRFARYKWTRCPCRTVPHGVASSCPASRRPPCGWRWRWERCVAPSRCLHGRGAYESSTCVCRVRCERWLRSPTPRFWSRRTPPRSGRCCAPGGNEEQCAPH